MRLELAHDALEGRVPVTGHGFAAAHGGPAPVGRRPALVTAQAASAIRGVISGKSITGCATRLK
jgi:hypothetical protein